MSTDQDPDDAKILEYARELFRQLGITRPDPDTVHWDETLPAESVIVQFGEVKLPMIMKGKLNPEDWRPLLASSIVYHYIMYPKRIKGAVIRVLLPGTVAVFLMTYLLLQILRLQYTIYSQNLLFALVLGFAAFTAVILSYWVNWYSRGLIFAADRRAGELVGRDALLLAFTKYRDAASSGSTRSQKLPWPRPSLERRIRTIKTQNRSL